jgi:Uma2 family endonuclease
MAVRTKETPPAAPVDQFRLPRQGEWTYEHWLNFPEDGWKYEIIDGVLHMSPPPAIAHQDSSGELFTAMRIYAKENDLGKVLTAPCGVRIPGQPVPLEPDILFVKKERLDIIGKQYVEGTPDLIVEILSPSNASYDRETKFKVYQDAGVPEYWLVDYEVRTVEVFTLVESVYTLLGRYAGDDVVSSAQLADFKITVNSLFNF